MSPTHWRRDYSDGPVSLRVMMLVIGAGAWVIGLRIHPEAHVQQHIHRPDDLLLLNRRDAAVRAVQGNEGSAGHLMAASKHIHRVINMV